MHSSSAQVLATFGHTNPPASFPAWRSLAALEHHALDEAPEALALAREEVELARAWGAPRTLGRALRILGLIEGGDDGIERIREAVAVLEPSPARLEHAYALADLGAALRRANHRAEAREQLRHALELAQRGGATLLAEQAHEELIATGARPRRIVLTGAASLTPSERRIAAMAAEGLSNREIAQALFVTLRTVEMHLSNAFRKLGVSSRTQLPAALATDGGGGGPHRAAPAAPEASPLDAVLPGAEDEADARPLEAGRRLRRRRGRGRRRRRAGECTGAERRGCKRCQRQHLELVHGLPPLPGASG